MKTIRAHQLEALFDYGEFIPFLKNYLSKKTTVPPRSHFDIDGNTLLLMPAWTDKYWGVKTATVFPGNGKINKPTVHATYVLFDAATGEPLLQIDGKALTNKRTAAASALASQYLSKKDSHKLLMLGNGALCPELIKAHAAVRPIEEVRIWGRNTARVRKTIRENDWGTLPVYISEKKEEDMEWADIVSAATGSIHPIVHGKYIRPGTHTDLVGSFKPGMREADDELIKKSDIYIDNEAAKKESGDIYIPLKNKIIKEDTLRGTLSDLALGKVPGRTSEAAVTVFKSVGFALEDIAAAEYIYDLALRRKLVTT